MVSRARRKQRAKIGMISSSDAQTVLSVYSRDDGAGGRGGGRHPAHRTPGDDGAELIASNSRFLISRRLAERPRAR